MAEEEVTAEWLDREFDRTKKQARELARILKIEPSAISRMRKNKRKIYANEAVKIKAFFSGEIQPEDVNLDPPGSLIIPGDQLVGARNLPVYGSAEGGAGSLIIDYDPVDYVKRPEPLLTVKGAYALLVTGESMIPAYRPGDLVLINPHVAPRTEDVCVFFREFLGETSATLKEYRAQTEREWRVRRYHPKVSDFTLSRADWRDCHKTVGKYDRR